MAFRRKENTHPWVSKKDYQSFLERQQLFINTITSNYQAVLRFCKWLEATQKTLHQINYEQVTHYVLYLRKKGLVDSSISNTILHLRYFFDYLQEQQILQHNPAQHLRLKRQNIQQQRQRLLFEVCSMEQLRCNYEAYCSNNRIMLRNKIMLGLYIFQGVSSGELDRIPLKNVDIVKGQIDLPSGIRLNQRVLALEAVQILLLYQWIQVQQSKGAYYLLEYNSVAHRKNATFNIFTRLHQIPLKSNERKVVNATHIRRSVIVHWLKHYNLRQVQYMAGHRRIGNTEDYQHSDISALHQAITKLHPLNDLDL